MTKDIVGKRFKSNNYNEFTVLRKTNEKHGKTALFEVEFDEYNGVVYKTFATKSNIIRGTIKNRYYPSVCGVGYIGNASKSENMLIYKRWAAILNRCYNLKADNYNDYGGRRIYVCERWLCFENFLEDFKKIDGYDEKNLENLELDKDIKLKGNKVYSPEVCMLVTSAKNMQNREFRKNKNFIVTSPVGEIYKNNNQKEFARKHNLHSNGINNVLNGRSKHHKGWKFEYIE